MAANKQMKIENIAVIGKKDIDCSVHETGRQYLVGDLKREQIIPNFFDKDVAMGIMEYKENGSDYAHWHTEISEYQYVLSGKAMLLNIDTWEEFYVEEGDSFAVPIHVKHVMKAKAGTKVLFVKNKCIDDKKMIEMTPEIIAWTKNMEF